jgi:uncharacterized protein involved in type VI secretion and phage assembly
MARTHDRSLPALVLGLAVVLGALVVADRSDARSPAPGGQVTSVATGVVTDAADPDGAFRVKVRFPWLAERDQEPLWARVVVPHACASSGVFCLPEVGDEVLVAFEHGDVRRPYVLGKIWDGR